MGLNDIELKRTAILFFDILNGYYHAAEGAAKARMKPMVDNAVLLMRAGREAGIPIFFAKGNHRADNATSALILTDTDMALKPWPDGAVKRGKMRVIGGDPSSEVIPELDPRPGDYYIPKYRWSAFHQTYLDLAASTTPAPAEPATPEPARQVTPEPAAHVSPAPPAPAAPPSPEPPAPEAVDDGTIAGILTAVLDELGSAHHRPFSRE